MVKKSRLPQGKSENDVFFGKGDSEPVIQCNGAAPLDSGAVGLQPTIGLVVRR